tara:strand:- start:66642 stop:66917 length:276 start_codon:yes stop_codon:yes gene_type:complete
MTHPASAPDMQRKLYQLEAALVELMISAQPFRHGRGLCERRDSLDAAMRLAGLTLRTVRRQPSAIERLWFEVEKAEAARRDEPGYRADLEK